MTNPESIFTTWHTPPEELVEKWTADYYKIVKYNNVTSINRHLASQAAQWGQQQRDEEIQRWFQQNTSEDLLQHLQEQATCILNEMFAARELAREVDKPPLIDPYLEQLLRLVETHIRMEDLRKASDIPAGFPTDRHVTAQESLENWGPLHVFDANGSQIKNPVSVCVSSGEVIVYVRNLDHELLRNPLEPSRLLEVPIKYPAPLSVRPVTYDSPR